MYSLLYNNNNNNNDDNNNNNNNNNNNKIKRIMNNKNRNINNDNIKGQVPPSIFIVLFDCNCPTDHCDTSFIIT